MRTYVYVCVAYLDKILEGKRFKIIIWMGKLHCLFEALYENTTV